MLVCCCCYVIRAPLYHCTGDYSVEHLTKAFEQYENAYERPWGPYSYRGMLMCQRQPCNRNRAERVHGFFCNARCASMVYGLFPYNW